MIRLVLVVKTSVIMIILSLLLEDVFDFVVVDPPLFVIKLVENVVMWLLEEPGNFVVVFVIFG